VFCAGVDVNSQAHHVSSCVDVVAVLTHPF